MPGPCSTPKIAAENGQVIEGKTAARRFQRPGEQIKVKVRKPITYRPLIIDPEDEDYE